MSRTPTAAQVLGRVVLVTGKEEFLSERTVGSVRDAVRAHDAEAEIGEATAADLTLATLGEMAAPSLFSSTRCVVVRGLENLPDESVDGLLDYAGDPADDIALVLVHGGGPKGSGRAGQAAQALRGHRGQVRGDQARRPDRLRDARSSPRTARGIHRRRVARSWSTAVGQDLRSLAAAAHQLTNDFPDEPITVDKVKRYFGGRAEATSFAVADAAFSGRREVALEELRWALDGGTAHGPDHLCDGQLGAQPRPLPRRRRGARDNDLARDLGVPPWKVKQVRDQSRGWTPDAIATRCGRSPPPTPTSRARPERRLVHAGAVGPHRHRPAHRPLTGHFSARGRR